MNGITPVTITLSRGYTDASGKVHKDVTFGKRLKGSDLMTLDVDKQAEIPTQYALLIYMAAITQFGSLTMPVPLKALLSLTRTDRDDLHKAYNRFATESAGERQPAFLSAGVWRLAFGFDYAGLIYDVVEFGAEVTGFDEVDADRAGLTGLSKELFLIGREITKLGQGDGTGTLEGGVSLDSFATLDAADVAHLRMASMVWRDSFRGAGKEVQVGVGTGSDRDGDENGMVGETGTVPATAEA